MRGRSVGRMLQSDASLLLVSVSGARIKNYL